MTNEQMKWSMVTPTTISDVGALLNHIDFFFDYLPIRDIVLIANRSVEKMVKGIDHVYFIDENELVDFAVLRTVIDSIVGHVPYKDRTGWYVQQFIKMGYSSICTDQYYLLWDSDTVPIRKCSFFLEGKPCFDIKKEFHEPYFVTIGRLFQGLNKRIDGSFISEHMIINTHYMREMLETIENNTALNGKNYQEKILYSIDNKDLLKSGFSEFETYGTFMTAYHPNFYTFRKWSSLRHGKYFYNEPMLSEYEKKWLSNNYDAISYEKSDSFHPSTWLFRTNVYMRIFSSYSLQKVSKVYSALDRINRK